MSVEKANIRTNTKDSAVKGVKRIFKIADTTSNSIGLISFAYWIFYIATGCITTIFDVGVSGVTSWLGFGLPLAFGLAFGGYKLFNYVKHKNANNEAKRVLNALTEDIEINREVKGVIHEAQPGIDMAPAAAIATQKVAVPGVSKFSILTAGVFGLVSSYIGWQYNFWYISDVLLKVFDIALTGASQAIGIGIVVTAFLASARALYQAYENYKARPEKHEGKSFFGSLLEDLTPNMHGSLLKQQQDRVEGLETIVRTLSNQYPHHESLSPVIDARLNQIRHFEERSKTHWLLQKLRNFGHITNFGMSAIFVLRTIIVQGTTSFLLPGLTGALLLSNPLTIGLFIGAGLIWGIWKYYNYRRDSNLEKISQANQHIDLLEKKIQILKGEKKPVPEFALDQVQESEPQLTIASDTGKIRVHPQGRTLSMFSSPPVSDETTISAPILADLSVGVTA